MKFFDGDRKILVLVLQKQQHDSRQNEARQQDARQRRITELFEEQERLKKEYERFNKPTNWKNLGCKCQ